MAQRQQAIDTNIAPLVVYNEHRSSILVQNLGTDVIWISENPADVKTQGQRLAQYDVYNKVRAFGGQSELALWVVADSTTATASITEDFTTQTYKTEFIPPQGAK